MTNKLCTRCGYEANITDIPSEKKKEVDCSNCGMYTIKKDYARKV